MQKKKKKSPKNPVFRMKTQESEEIHVKIVRLLLRLHCQRKKT